MTGCSRPGRVNETRFTPPRPTRVAHCRRARSIERQDLVQSALEQPLLRRNARAKHQQAAAPRDTNARVAPSWARENCALSTLASTTASYAKQSLARAGYPAVRRSLRPRGAWM